MNHQEILHWLKETNEHNLQELWQRADAVRRLHLGDEVHLRGLVEISNHCVRQCGYCGLRADNKKLERYRMSKDEILACAREAVKNGYGTIVIQAGEDYGIKTGWLADIIRRIKREMPLAVTLGLGERPDKDLEAWKRAGADRYLLRFETSDPQLYRLIHPVLPGRISNRIATLRVLKAMGYEAGGGVMIGIPGQTYDSLACDIEMFRELDLDMIGVGPYLPHPETPLGRGEWRREILHAEQPPNNELMTYKMIALARVNCPEANIPATTALATIDPKGRELGLMRGANVVMPNLTPVKYRAKYEIYPGKICIFETSSECHSCLLTRIRSIDRRPGVGPGGRCDRVSEVIQL
jgi:biotin synthase